MLDFEFAGILLALLLLEGLRRVPANAVVVRRIGTGEWQVAPPAAGGYMLVSWLPPFTTSLVLPPRQSGPSLDRAALELRWNAARRYAPWLMVIGTMVGLGLIIALPYAALRLTVAGFLITLAVVVVLTVITAVTGAAFLQKIGLDRRSAWRIARRWLSPFAAPAAGEGLLEAALADVPPGLAIHFVLPPPKLHEWLRPRAYDVVHGGASDPELAQLYADSALADLVKSRPAHTDVTAKAWCPRCGRLWRAPGSCDLCGVALIELIED